MFDRLTRRGALLTILLTAVTVGHPVVWASGLIENDGSHDSFPLSTYPMFASRVPEVYGMHHIIATGRDVEPVRVSKSYWTHGGMNQARGQLERAVSAHGRKDKAASMLHKFCEKSAKRIANLRGRAKARFAGRTKVQIVYSRYHLKNYFLGIDTEPASRRVRYSCPIVRNDDDAQTGHKRGKR